MLLSITLIVFIGFYFCYIASQKAAVSKLPLRLWAKSNAGMSKSIGGFFVLGALLLYVAQTGIGAGIFYGLVALMTVASLVVILLPMQWKFSK